MIINWFNRVKNYFGAEIIAFRSRYFYNEPEDICIKVCKSFMIDDLICKTHIMNVINCKSYMTEEITCYGNLC